MQIIKNAFVKMCMAALLLIPVSGIGVNELFNILPKMKTRNLAPLIAEDSELYLYVMKEIWKGEIRGVFATAFALSISYIIIAAIREIFSKKHRYQEKEYVVAKPVALNRRVMK